MGKAKDGPSDYVYVKVIPSTYLLNIGNGLVVSGGGTSPSFTIDTPHVITEMYSYNYGDGDGSPGAGTLALRAADGTVYGPWECTADEGQGGVPNALWFAYPDAEIPAGTYTMVNSNPATWSHNEQSGGLGFSYVKGTPVGEQPNDGCRVPGEALMPGHPVRAASLMARTLAAGVAAAMPHAGAMTSIPRLSSPATVERTVSMLACCSRCVLTFPMSVASGQASRTASTLTRESKLNAVIGTRRTESIIGRTSPQICTMTSAPAANTLEEMRCRCGSTKRRNHSGPRISPVPEGSAMSITSAPAPTCATAKDSATRAHRSSAASAAAGAVANSR